MVQLVKNPPAMQETWVQSLGWEDPMEKGKATHSSILAWGIPGTICIVHAEKAMATHSSSLAWKIPRMEEPGGLQSIGVQSIGHDLATEQQQMDAW